MGDRITPIWVIACRGPAFYSAAIPAHDNAYKNIFSHPQVVADLLTGFVDEDWVRAVDLSRRVRPVHRGGCRRSFRSSSTTATPPGPPGATWPS